MKKLVLFDVDGTLVDSETHIVPTSTIEALKLLHEEGYLLGIATGRSLRSIQEGGFCDIATWDVFICNNGQAVYDGECLPIHMAYIPKESVKACVAKAEALSSPLFIMGEKNQLTMEPNQNVYTSLAFFKESLPAVYPYDDSDVIMMMAYGDAGYDYQAYREIKGIDVIPGLSTYADIVLKGYHKYAGIQEVMRHFEIENYVAFGDSLNDVEMLEHAQPGIAMGNAHEDIKKLAYMITDCVMEDGIYNALQTLQMIR